MRFFSSPLLAFFFFSEYGTVICRFTLHNLLEILLRGNREVLTTRRLTTKKRLDPLRRNLQNFFIVHPMIEYFNKMRRVK